MPYIKAHLRQEIDPLVNQLATQITAQARQSQDPGACAGLLNYACTRLALQVVRARFGPMRYWLIAMLTGIFRNISDEFYRRLAAPYEDQQLAQSGDVDLFQEYLEEIGKM